MENSLTTGTVLVPLSILMHMSSKNSPTYNTELGKTESFFIMDTEGKDTFQGWLTSNCSR